MRWREGKREFGGQILAEPPTGTRNQCCQ
jgi:hypothetical protein